ncbi:MAG: type I 3-dehydroquinate dehydratase, partial [Promethearchaeota archaeon]
KLIFTAQKFEDNLIPLKLCKELSHSNQKIISFCMGSLGIFSRLMCVLTGSFLTYASLEEKTASGQLNIRKMREIFGILN